MIEGPQQWAIADTTASGERWLACLVRFPELDKNERYYQRKEGGHFTAKKGMHPLARLYRETIIQVVRPALPETPWFRHGWRFEGIFVAPTAWDWDHGHWITDDLVRAGLAGDDRHCHEGRLGRTFTDLVGGPPCVWLVAQEADVETTWPSNLWRN